MSAPDTNTKSEEKKHRPSLLGIRGVMIFAAVLLLGLLVWSFSGSENETEEANTGGQAEQVAPEGQETEEALEGYEEENYEPGGNSSGSVESDSQ